MFKFIGASLILGLAASPALSSSSIVYARIAAAGTLAHTVTVDLHDPDVRVSVALASGGRGRAEGFKSIVKRTHPKAALTGTFFDTRTLIPTGDIAVFGTLVNPGCIGSALCIDANNKASIVSLRAGRLCITRPCSAPAPRSSETANPHWRFDTRASAVHSTAPIAEPPWV